MISVIVNIFVEIIIIVLVIRYFIEPYQYYGYGPVLHAIFEVTDRLLQPIRQAIPQAQQTLRHNIVWAAIVVVLVIRGLVLWIFGAAHPLTMVSPLHGISALPNAMAISLTMGIILIAKLIVIFLFASLMVSRRGVMMCASAGFNCFQEKTFAVFNYTRRFIGTDNLVTLFLASAGAIVLGTGLLAGITSLAFMQSSAAYEAAVVITVFEILQWCLGIYTIMLILTILASWVGADQFSSMVQVLRSMTDPYLNIFRRLCPWARIDFIDLSPIFAFIVLNPVLSGILVSIQTSLLRMIIQPAGIQFPTI